MGSTAICKLIEVCTAGNCSTFQVSFVWNRVQKWEDFGLKEGIIYKKFFGGIKNNIIFYSLSLG